MLSPSFDYCQCPIASVLAYAVRGEAAMAVATPSAIAATGVVLRVGVHAVDLRSTASVPGFRPVSAKAPGDQRTGLRAQLGGDELVEPFGFRLDADGLLALPPGLVVPWIANGQYPDTLVARGFGHPGHAGFPPSGLIHRYMEDEVRAGGRRTMGEGFVDGSHVDRVGRLHLERDHLEPFARHVVERSYLDADEIGSGPSSAGGPAPLLCRNLHDQRGDAAVPRPATGDDFTYRFIDRQLALFRGPRPLMHTLWRDLFRLLNLCIHFSSDADPGPGPVARGDEQMADESG